LLSVFCSEKNCAINIQHAVVLVIVGKQKLIVLKVIWPVSARNLEMVFNIFMDQKLFLCDEQRSLLFSRWWSDCYIGVKFRKLIERWWLSLLALPISSVSSDVPSPQELQEYCVTGIYHVLMYSFRYKTAVTKTVLLHTQSSVMHYSLQWRTQEFCSGAGGGSTNSVEDRGNGDMGSVAP
jgi:hypothetical protein